MKIDLFNPISYNDFLIISSEKRDHSLIISLKNNYIIERINKFLIESLDRENDDRSFLNINYPVIIIKADLVIHDHDFNSLYPPSQKSKEVLEKFSEKFMWIKEIYTESGWDVDFRMMLNNPCFIFSEKKTDKKEESNSVDKNNSRFKLMEI